jgi:hypothetical protein
MIRTSPSEHALACINELPPNESWPNLIQALRKTWVMSISPQTLDRAILVFSDEASAIGWLTSENRTLGGKAPIDLASEGKEQEVLNALGRLEHGVIA